MTPFDALLGAALLVIILAAGLVAAGCMTVTLRRPRRQP